MTEEDVCKIPYSKPIIGIYKITNPSGRVYIGQSRSIRRRLNDYKRNKYKDQIKIYNSINKYGWEAHIFEVIEECQIEDLYILEDKWQTYYNSIIEGLNCRGFKSGDKPTLISEETREKLRKGSTGKKMPAATKQKLIESNIGRKKSEEELEKIVKALRGRKVSEETREKIRSTQKGRKTPIERTQKWLDIYLDKSNDYRNAGELFENSRIILDVYSGIFYYSLRSAAQAINMNHTTLQSWLSGRYKNKSNFIRRSVKPTDTDRLGVR